MKKTHIISALTFAAAIAVSGCASSFKTANEENTKRASDFREGFLEMAVNDMLTINQCWVVAIKTGKGAESCSGMAIALSLTNKFLYAFLAKPEMSRVPAAPEEVVQAVLFKGFEFAILKYGISAVKEVVNAGQVANAQLAAQAIEAAEKPPLVVDKPVIVQVPAGSTAPAPAPAGAIAPSPALSTVTMTPAPPSSPQ